MDDANAVVAETAAGQGGVDVRAVADQEEGGDLFAGLQGAHGAFNDDAAAVVATHDIHCDSHKRAGREVLPRASKDRLSSRFDGEHLPSLVIAASRTNPVGHIRRSTLRAGAELGQSEDAVVGAAHPLAAVRRFTLGDTHN